MVVNNREKKSIKWCRREYIDLMVMEYVAIGLLFVDRSERCNSETKQKNSKEEAFVATLE